MGDLSKPADLGVRRRPGMLVAAFVAAPLLAVGIAAAAFVALSGGDDGCGGGCPPPAGPTGPVATAPPTPRITVAATAATAPTTTPSAQVRETVAADPRRAVIYSVIYQNGPVYIEALCRRDPAILRTIFAGAALRENEQRVARESAARSDRCAELLSLTLVSLSEYTTTATATTNEVWRFYRAGICTEFAYEEAYQLELIGNQWLIIGNQFAERSRNTCG